MSADQLTHESAVALTDRRIMQRWARYAPHALRTAAARPTAPSRSLHALRVLAAPTSSSTPVAPFDLAVIGGGIVGIACARELALRHPKRRICLLEKEPALAQHQSSHNSGVIHAGLYYKPGSQRAQLCAVGAAMLFDYCRKHQLPALKVGKLVVAVDASEMAGLHAIFERAKANGVPDLEMLTSSELTRLEPNVRGHAAILSPHTGIAHFGRIAEHMAGELASTGAQIKLGFELQSATRSRVDDSAMELRSSAGDVVHARHALVCGGVFADRLAQLFGGSPTPSVVPVRGTWLQLRPGLQSLVQRNIYPVPDSRFPFLGVHLTPVLGLGDDGSSSMVNGIIIGPNAVLASSREGYSWTDLTAGDVWDMVRNPLARSLVSRHLRFGFDQLRGELAPKHFAMEAIQRYVPGLHWSDILTTRPFWFLPWLERPVLRSGVRAQALNAQGNLEEDFVIEVQRNLGEKNAGGSGSSSSPASIVHLRNAPSPAATSSLAIAQRVADRAEQAFHW